MLKDQIDEKKILQLHRELDDPLLENEDLKNKLRAFVDYVREIPHLPEPRKRYRVGKTFEMIEKLRKWYLIEYLNCSSAEKIDLSTDVQYARGVGPGRKKKLKKLGIETLKDLLEFFPRDYEDRRKVLKLNELIPGRKVTTQGKISSVEKKKFQNMNILVAVLSDDRDREVESLHRSIRNSQRRSPSKGKGDHKADISHLPPDFRYFPETDEKNL